MTNEEAFEKWYEADAMPLESNWFIKDEDGKYAKDYVYLVWKGWQSAISYMQEQSEPVGYLCESPDKVARIFVDKPLAIHSHTNTPLYTSPQPRDCEPVAMVGDAMQLTWINSYGVNAGSCLYTSPQPRDCEDWQYFDKAYKKAAETSDATDWMNAALLAQQVRRNQLNTKG